ncbi:MAG: response regulator [Deltaproteobacteria bacterium]
MNKISVLIADDHSLMRQGLKQIIELEEDIKVIGQATNGQEAIDMAKSLNPDVILMDINMPILNGLQAIKEIRDSGMDVKIVVLTIHEDRDYLFKTLQLGANAYVLKDAESNILINAIRTVFNGQNYIQHTMTSELVKEFNRISRNDKQKGPEHSLTQREIEVLELIAEGMLNKNIAKTLFISEKTVKNHVSNIFKKLNVTDRTQAAIYALKNNIKK